MTQVSKTAIVTGASSGIGLATAGAFVDQGYNVVLTGTDKVKLIAATTDVGSPGNVLPVVSDVTVNTDRQRLVEITLSRFGRIDVLVNNAGAIFPPTLF